MNDYIPQIILSLIVIIVWWLSKFLAGKLVHKYGKKLQKSELRRKQMKQVMNIMLNILFIIIFILIWAKPGNLLVFVSSAFAILGVALFAQWSILSNVTAGVIMFFGAPFRIGDRIRIVDKDVPIEAVVENIHTFYTHIRTPENELIVLPNNVFLQKIVSIKE